MEKPGVMSQTELREQEREKTFKHLQAKIFKIGNCVGKTIFW